MRLLYLVAFFSFFIIPGFAQADRTNYSEAFRLIEVWLDAQKDFEKLPGISAAVVDDQEVLWSEAFGLANVEKNVKMKSSTICSICSISKLFTSIAIMKLYDEGNGSDDCIGDLLPWYDLQQKFPDSGPITIRSLLTHSSGLPREANFPYWTGPDFLFPTSDQIKEELSEQETLYPASTWFQYSNLGMTLLGEIVEEISGISYDEYIRQNILIPLALNDTRTELPEALYGSQLAIGYSAINRNAEREKVNFFQANGIKPAAGLSSNVLDLGKFASWQFQLMETTTAEILRPSALKYMYNVHWADPGVHWSEPYWKMNWGLGFMVFEGQDKSKLVGHGGDCPGYRSFLILDPETKIAVAVMINANGTNPEKYASGIIELMNKSESDKKKMTTGSIEFKK